MDAVALMQYVPLSSLRRVTYHCSYVFHSCSFAHAISLIYICPPQTRPRAGSGFQVWHNPCSFHLDVMMAPSSFARDLWMCFKHLKFWNLARCPNLVLVNASIGLGGYGWPDPTVVVESDNDESY